MKNNIIKKIQDIKLAHRVNLMEVCGTHTMQIAKYGIKELLPANVNLISGPGCPVCVSPIDYIDKAVFLAKQKDVIVTTFGDMIKVPGTNSSLEKINAETGNVKIVYSPIDALEIAKKNKSKKVIFLAVGFETTVPTIAATILAAKRDRINNLYILEANKVIPEALEALIVDKQINIDGFILPGHVSTIIGAIAYENLDISGVITGFEDYDILDGIYMLLKQILENRKKIEIQYKRSVRYEGNSEAKKIIKEVFDKADSNWRGVGVIPNSGLSLRDEFIKFSAEKLFEISIPKSKENKACICGAILKGLKNPKDCKLFGKICTPEDPKGACMVSSEGTCAAEYKYRAK